MGVVDWSGFDASPPGFISRVLLGSIARFGIKAFPLPLLHSSRRRLVLTVARVDVPGGRGGYLIC